MTLHFIEKNYFHKIYKILKILPNNKNFPPIF